MLTFKQIDELTNAAKAIMNVMETLDPITDALLAERDTKRAQRVNNVNKDLAACAQEVLALSKSTLAAKKLILSLQNSAENLDKEYYNLYAGKGEKL